MQKVNQTHYVFKNKKEIAKNKIWKMEYCPGTSANVILDKNGKHINLYPDEWMEVLIDVNPNFKKVDTPRAFKETTKCTCDNCRDYAASIKLSVDSVTIYLCTKCYKSDINLFELKSMIMNGS